ncbi:MAG: 4-hydroxyphenylacetate 3-hydroxylase family protein, partial [Acetobacteraceae bacterium]
MGIRTGAAYLAALRDDREIWIDGERVGDVTADRRFASAARAVAALYDMQHAPDLRARMTYASPTTGVPVGLSFIQPASIDDLVARREMVKTWNDSTCGMLGRSPDYMNIMLTGFASANLAFGEKDKRFADNVLNYYLHVRENDLTMTHTLVNPQVDRSRPVEQQAKDLAAKIVRETSEGIVITGARMVSTLAAFSDDILVMPSTYISDSPDAAPYAFGFSVKVGSPGLRFICRPSVSHLEAASPMDWPLSLRFDEADAMAVFDDVLVPWERVFIYRDVEVHNTIYARTGARSALSHQFITKDLAKAEFMMALAFTLARTTKVDGFLHIEGLLAEHINNVEVIRACILAAETEAKVSPHGIVVPADGPLNAVRFLFPQMFRRACESIQIIGAGGLVMVPSFAELDGPMAEVVATYCQAAGADSRERIKLFRLAFDA